MSDAEIFKKYTESNYVAQGKAFLNAYWGEVESSAEEIWDIFNVFVEIDYENGKEGCDLDEFSAHRVLERFGETRSVREMRDELRAVDMDFNRRVAFLEYLLFKWGKSVEDFVSKPQDASEELREAEAALAEAQSALAEAQAALEASTAAATKAAEEAETAKNSAEAARVKQEEALELADVSNKAAADAKAAEDELLAAMADLEAQESEFENAKTTLKQKMQEGGIVSRNKAAAELAQLEATDPLPLRQAKLNTGAATRKAEKARIAADEAAASANAAADAATEAKNAADADAEAAEESRVASEQAANEAREKAGAMEEKFTSAETTLKELARVAGGSSGQGAIWWMERELAEARKYAPTTVKLK